MAEREYSVNNLRQLVKAQLEQTIEEMHEAMVQLRYRELNKALPPDSHVEPGEHEAVTSGAQPHMEPGTDEKFALDPIGNDPIGHSQQPVGSGTGLPMNGLPSPDMCAMCGNEDAPGSCNCLGAGMGKAELEKGFLSDVGHKVKHAALPIAAAAGMMGGAAHGQAVSRTPSAIEQAQTRANTIDDATQHQLDDKIHAVHIDNRVGELSGMLLGHPTKKPSIVRPVTKPAVKKSDQPPSKANELARHNAKIGKTEVKKGTGQTPWQNLGVGHKDSKAAPAPKVTPQANAGAFNPTAPYGVKKSASVVSNASDHWGKDNHDVIAKADLEKGVLGIGNKLKWKKHGGNGHIATHESSGSQFYVLDDSAHHKAHLESEHPGIDEGTTHTEHSDVKAAKAHAEKRLSAHLKGGPTEKAESECIEKAGTIHDAGSIGGAGDKTSVDNPDVMAKGAIGTVPTSSQDNTEAKLANTVTNLAGKISGKFQKDGSDAMDGMGPAGSGPGNGGAPGADMAMSEDVKRAELLKSFGFKKSEHCKKCGNLNKMCKCMAKKSAFAKSAKQEKAEKMKKAAESAGDRINAVDESKGSDHQERLEPTKGAGTLPQDKVSERQKSGNDQNVPMEGEPDPDAVTKKGELEKGLLTTRAQEAAAASDNKGPVAKEELEKGRIHGSPVQAAGAGTKKPYGPGLFPGTEQKSEVKDANGKPETCGKCAAVGSNSKGPGAHAPGCPKMGKAEPLDKGRIHGSPVQAAGAGYGPGHFPEMGGAPAPKKASIIRPVAKPAPAAAPAAPALKAEGASVPMAKPPKAIVGGMPKAPKAAGMGTMKAEPVSGSPGYLKSMSKQNIKAAPGGKDAKKAEPSEAMGAYVDHSKKTGKIPSEQKVKAIEDKHGKFKVNYKKAEPELSPGKPKSSVQHGAAPVAGVDVGGMPGSTDPGAGVRKGLKLPHKGGVMAKGMGMGMTGGQGVQGAGSGTASPGNGMALTQHEPGEHEGERNEFAADKRKASADPSIAGKNPEPSDYDPKDYSGVVKKAMPQMNAPAHTVGRPAPGAPMPSASAHADRQATFAAHTPVAPKGGGYGASKPPAANPIAGHIASSMASAPSLPPPLPGATAGILKPPPMAAKPSMGVRNAARPQQAKPGIFGGLFGKGEEKLEAWSKGKK